MICLNCENEISNNREGCSKCGFKPLPSEFFTCPNSIEGICIFNGEFCSFGESFMSCSIKIQADKESLV